MSTQQHKLTIGLFGFGVVGESIYNVLQQTPSLEARIKKICIKHYGKKREAPASLFTTDKDELLLDRDINVIIEVIDDADAAFDIVQTALQNGKHVVSANKKMIAGNLPALLRLQEDSGCSLLYEAAACASIPVIRNLEEYYDNDLLQSIRGIINGSTNYILTKIKEQGLSFAQSLLEAQQAGFAESDPTLDINGYDAVNKWSFLLAHAYGISVYPSGLLFNGIQDIHQTDFEVAAARRQQVKLVAHAQKLKNGKLAAFVLPQFTRADDLLAFVKNEYNGIVIESRLADKQFFYGKGAGGLPTASAILSDIAALRYNYKYEYKKRRYSSPVLLCDDFYLRVYLSFDDLSLVPSDRFEWIDEWHASAERKYLNGVISYKELKENSWWKENGNSLILLPDPVVEDVQARRLKRRSLELAGCHG